MIYRLYIYSFILCTIATTK
uniref:Uncharacterized protein n=1 Tax=Lepeophtheirus salmonis TaxID=72036 RepID=A0A0K2UIR9_LEPSM